MNLALLFIYRKSDRVSHFTKNAKTVVILLQMALNCKNCENFKHFEQFSGPKFKLKPEYGLSLALRRTENPNEEKCQIGINAKFGILLSANFMAYQSDKLCIYLIVLQVANNMVAYLYAKFKFYVIYHSGIFCISGIFLFEFPRVFLLVKTKSNFETEY